MPHCISYSSYKGAEQHDRMKNYLKTEGYQNLVEEDAVKQELGLPSGESVKCVDILAFSLPKWACKRKTLH
jgi:hypothetical protein